MHEAHALTCLRALACVPVETSVALHELLELSRLARHVRVFPDDEFLVVTTENTQTRHRVGRSALDARARLRALAARVARRTDAFDTGRLEILYGGSSTWTPDGGRPITVRLQNTSRDCWIEFGEHDSAV
jgi:hypothetical protein